MNFNNPCHDGRDHQAHPIRTITHHGEGRRGEKEEQCVEETAFSRSRAPPRTVAFLHCLLRVLCVSVVHPRFLRLSESRPCQRSIRRGFTLLSLLILVSLSGCCEWDAKKPQWLRGKDEPRVPVKVVAMWKDTILYRGRPAAVGPRLRRPADVLRRKDRKAGQGRGNADGLRLR